MPLQHETAKRADADEYERFSCEIGDTIRALMRCRGVRNKDVGDAINISGNAVSQILSGKSCMQYAKLKKLAAFLDTTPNHILGVTKPNTERELFRGTLEGALVAFGHSEFEAQEIATIAVAVIDRPASAGEPYLRGRPVTEFLVRQYVDSKRQ
jgi:transcriptional regulator with XRE-family HTH domain